MGCGCGKQVAEPVQGKVRSADEVLVRYVGGPELHHEVIGAATNQSYGMRRVNSRFYVHYSDLEGSDALERV